MCGGWNSTLSTCYLKKDTYCKHLIVGPCSVCSSHRLSRVCLTSRPQRRRHQVHYIPAQNKGMISCLHLLMIFPMQQALVQQDTPSRSNLQRGQQIPRNNTMRCSPGIRQYRIDLDVKRKHIPANTGLVFVMLIKKMVLRTCEHCLVP